MLKADLLTITGTKAGTINLPEEIFAAKINPQLEALAVRVYLSNQRKARAKTKTRTDVNRTKAKWYRQKGTGRARHGSRAAPIFVGGGVSHGPTGEQNFKLKMSEKMRRRALFSALSSKFKNKEIVVIEGLEKIEPKTKKMSKVLEALKIKREVLLILPKKIENLTRSARNIKNVNLGQVGSLNTYGILRNDKIIFLKESVKALKEIFLRN